MTNPTKIVLERRAKAGEESHLEAWARTLVESANSHYAVEGSTVLSAEAAHYFILLRFASAAELERWRASPKVVELFRRGDEISTAGDEPVVRSGLETWFTLPGVPAPPRAPPKWKMALLTWCALLPQVLILGEVLPASLPPLLNVALGTAIPVSMLTWVIMPRLTKALYGWLYKPELKKSTPIPISAREF